MNDWTPPQDPHENHPHFPFDPHRRNPVKGLRKKSPPIPNTPPTTSKEQFEAMCAELLNLIDDFNQATMDCKLVATGTPEQVGGARKNYDAAVAALNQFIGKTPGVSKPGYREFVHRDSLKIEVVLSSGFVLAARIFGDPLLSNGPINPYGSLSSVCSSSYYSLYSAYTV